MKTLWHFKGGIKLPGHKAESTTSQVIKSAIPEKLYMPLQQHIGVAAAPVISVGDQVYKGQLIAAASSYVSAPIHASTSGTVVAIEKHAVAHQSGLAENCIVIAADGKDVWDPTIKEVTEPESLTTDELLSRISSAGIVGLGGAVFPAAVKLKPTRMIDTLIINGVECEPYITCDDMLMRTQPDDIILGILLLRRILQPAECIIAIEDNKPEAIKSLQERLDHFREAGLGRVNTIRIVPVPTLYPAGGEKQLIKVLTGKEVPQQGLPYEVGIVCQNIGTVAAIKRAVYAGKPLVSRLVTVTGPNIKHAANYEVLLGTPVDFLIRQAGGTVTADYKVIMGGPMMGQLLPNEQVPITKASNCILVEKKEPVTRHHAMPCIRCGACATVCPINLLPQQLYWHARGQAFEKLAHYKLADCIECGCCAVVCPSTIPLVQYFRFAKSAAKTHEAKLQFAEQSRARTQAREARLERMARELEERKAKRKAARQQKVSKTIGPASTTSSNENTTEHSAL